MVCTVRRKLERDTGQRDSVQGRDVAASTSRQHRHLVNGSASRGELGTWRHHAGWFKVAPDCTVQVGWPVEVLFQYSKDFPIIQ
jgi:hypothetical protein